ncbi:MAG TPA: LacI family DNA-binding transcriptional regulator [Thermohalobaculum sp.]|nr:LacI family DNA-binding transcriptional regulator [Thermohalobaculum sp.]
MSASGLPTLDDVARHAGVSTATVSRCLNAPDRVRPETRARVEQVVAELGYTPNLSARALASNRTNTVGAVIPTMESAIFALGLQALQDELSARGVTLLVATSHYDPEREADQVRTLLARGVDGVVLIGEARPPATYKLLEDRGTPFVLVWSYRGDCPYPCVGFDNRAAARSMAEQVLDRGHRRIGMIAGITAGNDRASDRVAGVREALHGRGLELEEPYLAETAYSVEASAAIAQTLLSLSPRPTAIICGNDVQAAGAIRGARALGLETPRDLSVVGFDDIELASATTPEITTVRVPHRRMGRAAAQLLLRMVGSDQPGERIEFETAVVERASLAAPPADA